MNSKWALFYLSVLVLFLITFTNCKKKKTDAPKELMIGQSYQGGIIAYIFKAGDKGFVEGETHGLIASAYDQDTSTPWGCYSISIPGAVKAEMGTGEENTKAIVAACQSSDIAARLCYDLELRGYTDWYLPSKDELNKLYVYKDKIGDFSPRGSYWSSTQYDDNGAWMQVFSSGLANYFGKAYPHCVRAVRTF